MSEPLPLLQPRAESVPSDFASLGAFPRGDHAHSTRRVDSSAVSLTRYLMSDFGKRLNPRWIIRVVVVPRHWDEIGKKGTS
jgi:hypothetical protein